MDKVKYIPLALFVLFSGKALFFGAGSYESAAVLLILGVIAGFYEFKSQDALIRKLQERIDAQDAANVQIGKDLESVKNHLSTLKLSNQFRQQKAL